MLRGKQQRDTTAAIGNGEDVENPFGRDLVETPSGLQYTDVRVGAGDVPATGDVIVAHVKGFLPDGSVFDDSRAVGQPLVLSAGVRPRGVCEGLEEGLLSMRAGGIRLLAVPNELAFGRQTVFGSIGIVPGGSAVRYEVETLRCLDTEAGLVCCTEPEFPCKAPQPIPGDAVENSPLMRAPTTEEMSGLE